MHLYLCRFIEPAELIVSWTQKSQIFIYSKSTSSPSPLPPQKIFVFSNISILPLRTESPLWLQSNTWRHRKPRPDPCRSRSLPLPPKLSLWRSSPPPQSRLPCAPGCVNHRPHQRLSRSCCGKSGTPCSLKCLWRWANRRCSLRIGASPRLCWPCCLLAVDFPPLA